MGYVPTHWEDAGRLPPQGDPQVEGEADEYEDGWYLGLPPTGGGDDGGRPAGGGYIHRLPPEHSREIHCDKTHYRPVSGGGATTGENGVEAVVGAGVPWTGGETDGDCEYDLEIVFAIVLRIRSWKETED